MIVMMCVDSVGAEKTLRPDDYEVTSVARECEEGDRGNKCDVDVDELGVTCYSSCTTHYCNDQTPRLTWRDLLRARLSRQTDRDDPSTTPGHDTTNDRKNNSLQLPRAGAGKLLANQEYSLTGNTPCPEKNGITSILGITLTKFNKFL